MSFQRDTILRRLKPGAEPRGPVGQFSRGNNVYRGGLSSAHSGGGPQYGRPRGSIMQPPGQQGAPAQGGPPQPSEQAPSPTNQFGSLPKSQMMPLQYQTKFADPNYIGTQFQQSRPDPANALGALYPQSNPGSENVLQTLFNRPKVGLGDIFEATRGNQ